MGKIEAIRHNVRDIVGTRARHRIAFVHLEGARAVVSRLTGALVRAFLVMVLVATPSVILPGIGTDTKQMVALVALFAGALTFAEYNAAYPSLVEFRDAPPFNRVRYLMLFAIVFVLSVICAAKESDAAFPRLFEAVGILIGHAMDFPYSPVRLATMMMADGASEDQVMAVRTAAGTAYILSLIALAFFVLVFKLRSWPGRHATFNVWVNLPTFEPTAGGDIVSRQSVTLFAPDSAAHGLLERQREIDALAAVIAQRDETVAHTQASLGDVERRLADAQHAALAEVVPAHQVGNWDTIAFADRPKRVARRDPMNARTFQRNAGRRTCRRADPHGGCVDLIRREGGG